MSSEERYARWEHGDQRGGALPHTASERRRRERTTDPVDALYERPVGHPIVVNVNTPTPQRTPNRLLHGVMTLLTGGIWLPVWLIAEHRAKRRG